MGARVRDGKMQTLVVGIAQEICHRLFERTKWVIATPDQTRSAAAVRLYSCVTNDIVWPGAGCVLRWPVRDHDIPTWLDISISDRRIQIIVLIVAEHHSGRGRFSRRRGRIPGHSGRVSGGRVRCGRVRCCWVPGSAAKSRSEPSDPTAGPWVSPALGRAVALRIGLGHDRWRRRIANREGVGLTTPFPPALNRVAQDDRHG
jgi:hypothetical protein